jgi:hypothetical protein
VRKLPKASISSAGADISIFSHFSRSFSAINKPLISGSIFNETQATGIPMHRDELELAGRIIPKAKRRDNFGSNSPPLGAG